MFACIHSPNEDAAAIAGRFSPLVERVSADTALFSTAGLERLYGDARRLGDALAAACPGASVAIAATPDTAVLAAHHLDGIAIIPAGEEVRYLGSLPLDRLPLDPAMWGVLDRWGLRTFEDLACLPEDGLRERLGEAGVRLHRIARGALGRPVRHIVPDTVYQESVELDYAIEAIEPLLFLLARFLHELCGRLKSQSLAAGDLLLKLNRIERRLRLPFPTLDVKFLLKLLQHELESKPSGEPVVKVALRVVPTTPRRVQHDLFSIPAPEPERLELTLGKIRGMVGDGNVKVPQVMNTHRPGWGPASSRLAFRHFRPPLNVRVELREGLPRRVDAPGAGGTVTEISGPWRTSGGWWLDTAWDRDEFDLMLSDGAVYRLCFDRRGARWILEGVYD